MLSEEANTSATSSRFTRADHPHKGFSALRLIVLIAHLIFLALILTPVRTRSQERRNWDQPAAPSTPSHDDVARNGALLADFIEAGRQFFRTQFNILDGAGRPEATGDSKPTVRVTPDALSFSRIAGPDANSCSGCHNQPFIGGAGEFAVNVFVGAHFTDPPTFSTDPKITNERNTTGIFGAGAIEMLAREMTEDFAALRDKGMIEARKRNEEIEVPLQTKGVSFGSITVRPDGTYDSKRIQGVDEDLIVKPFGSKGVAVSLREFTNFALNQHHGIQPQERFGWERTGIKDFDGDGVEVEMTVGQVSALTLYLASLPPPRQAVYKDQKKAAQARLGERKFKEIGCATCHIPALPLRSKHFSEPNLYNRPGSLVLGDVVGPIVIPLEIADGTGVYRSSDGQLYVAAFTDLKRHRICDRDDPHFCNEARPQDFVPTDEFLTTKLWDVGTSAPYGHRGDLTTLSEAIIHHSGEAKETKNAFLRLTSQEKSAIVTFLLSLRVEVDLPPRIKQTKENQR